MKKITNTIRWTGVAIFGVMAISSLISSGLLSALLFFLGGLIIAPLDFVQNLRSRLKLNRTLSIVLAIVLLFGGAFTMPNLEVSDYNTSSSQTAETVSENSSKSDKITDISKDNSSETTSKREDTSSKEETISNPTPSTKPESTVCPHTETTIKNQSNATCTENGYSGDTYCNACNKIVTNGSQIAATGHNAEIRNKKSATTTNEGYSGDTYCKICGIKISTGNVIPRIVDNTQ